MINKIFGLREAWENASRAIDRQRLLCDLDKTVLLGDFIDCFNVGVTPQKPTELKRLQLHYIDDKEIVPRLAIRFGPMPETTDSADELHDDVRIYLHKGPYSYLEYNLAIRDLPVSLIPAQLLPQRAQERCAAPLVGSRCLLDEAEQAFNAEPTRTNFIALQRADLTLQAHEMAYPQVEMAVPLAPLLLAVDDTPLIGHFFDRAKLWSVAKRQEKVISDFWNAVSALEDFSDLIPPSPNINLRPPSNEGDYGIPILRPSVASL